MAPGGNATEPTPCTVTDGRPPLVPKVSTAARTDVAPRSSPIA